VEAGDDRRDADVGIADFLGGRRRVGTGHRVKGTWNPGRPAIPTASGRLAA
jgi:hypothetical protein